MIFFLGRSTKWKTFSIEYYFNGLFRIPCRFDLRKYPFESQRCELNTWFDVPVRHIFNFSSYYPNGAVTFRGRSRIGEYSFRSAYSETRNNNQSVSMFIELDPFFGYHLLNSFLTSFLILLICFATFFFRVDDFNERIMVSLTALLVLTALFTQANSVTVNTSYLKLLDIWYAVLIISAFFSVVLNTALNAYYHKLKTRVEFDGKEEDIGAIKRKLASFNAASLVVLTGGFSLFLFFFALSAAGII